MLKRLISAGLMLLLSVGILLAPLGQNYKSPLMWAHYGKNPENPVDVFIVGATADWGEDGTWISSTYLPIDREMQAGLMSMQMSFYQDVSRVYAPFYRQTCLSVYYRPDAERGQYLAFSYKDVEAAFLYYLEHENQGRPFILAGFSQGSDLALRLMQKHFDDETLQSQLVAAYLIGWRIVEEDLRDFPHLKMAEGELDTGVIVSFNSEADFVTGSIIVPEGGYTYGINPLNWKTDDTLATKEENPGYCTLTMSGVAREPIPYITGCYRDQERGTIIPVDITPEEYPPKEDLFVEGCYHDYELNLYHVSVRENVKNRTEQYLSK